MTIDGNPDSPADGALALGDGRRAAGRASIVALDQHRHPELHSTSHYLDDSTPGAGAETQCTGDAQAYRRERAVDQREPAEHGPAQRPVQLAGLHRTIYFEAPGKANGAARAAEAGSPFQIDVSPSRKRPARPAARGG